MEPTVFCRGVEMSRSRRGVESNFFSHLAQLPLDFFATLAQGLNDLLDAEFVDNAQALPRDLKLDEAFLGLQPESLGVKVGQEPAARPVKGVGNIVPRHRALSGDLADSGHLYA